MSEEVKTMLKYAAIALAAYLIWDKLVYPYLYGPESGNGTGEPIGSGDKTPEQIAADVKAANAKTASEALQAQQDKLAADAKALRDRAAASTIAANEAATIAQRLQKAAGSQTSLNVDGWNYYLRTLNPNAVVSDLAEVGITREMPLSVNQYLSERMKAGLMDAAAPYFIGNTGVTGIPSRMLN